ncbi:FMN-dependent NADH-azoreductase [Chamaesiphon polymorphus]|uniref:FMN dependent NADH:quinone oxidoreductase n=1 Tax=Chamaesiphon polymorphus CCALA 037 TaxID=2107692 RepID=A0A2T1G774_9CYAN|nr:NAD(P)H-dependent oxidoreductase [Chamaesiphon polymorphus]PSB53053.1 FMN-dependent NADH-azoreductase [Chamaesiphon polymorphus CCALA 037]
MSFILQIDSSYSGSDSASRLLAREFVTAWKQHHPDCQIAYRDLALQPVPYVDRTWVSAMNLSPDRYNLAQQQTMQASEPIVSEFLAADGYIFALPMYGFTVPAAFKAYLEHLIRPGRTYTIDEHGLRGIVPPGKKMLVITSRGAEYNQNSPLANFDFHEPYLRTIFGSFGIENIEFIYANNLELGDRDKSIAAAKTEIHALARTW